jgi:hypothetical protein
MNNSLSTFNIIVIKSFSQMNRLLVTATNGSIINKFEKRSIQEAYNLKDFLEQTGEYKRVTIYQLEKELGPIREWTEIVEISL